MLVLFHFNTKRNNNEFSVSQPVSIKLDLQALVCFKAFFAPALIMVYWIKADNSHHHSPAFLDLQHFQRPQHFPSAVMLFTTVVSYCVIPCHVHCCADSGGELIMVKLRWIYGKALVLVLYFTGIFLKQQAEALYDALVKRATRLKGLFANFSRLLQTSVVQFFSRLLSWKVGQIAPCWLVLLELIGACAATNHICRSEWQKFVFFFLS